MTLLIGCQIHLLLEYRFQLNCPWTSETQMYNRLLFSFKVLLESVVESYLVFCLLLLTVGYQMVLSNITSFSFKLVFFLTTCKFVTDQIIHAFHQISLLIPTLVFVRAMFELVMFVVVCVYICQNLQQIRFTIVQLRHNSNALPQLDLICQQLGYRFRLSLVCYIFILSYFLINILLTISGLFSFGQNPGS